MGKISLIITVLNEEKTIEKLLESITRQTRKPEEIVIVDGKSKDRTIGVIRGFGDFGGRIKIFEKKGNRAAGRNTAIKAAMGEIICITDAGCELDKKWIEKIVEPFEKDESFIRRPPAETLRFIAVTFRGRGDAFNTTEVVAGYYQVSRDSDIFQKCAACYALVPPEKIDPENFLPSSRSMAIRKSVWEKFGGFEEGFGDNEDYVFAQKLKKVGVKMAFVKNAVVYWTPRDNLKDFFKMIYRFAKGDAKAGLRRGKVLTIFGRYLIGLICLIGEIWLGSLWVLGYLGWSIWKNYKYINHWKAIFYLPVLQIVSDLGVMGGTIKGNYDQLRHSD